MTEEQLQNLRELCENGTTDSGIEDWCEENGFAADEPAVWEQIAVWSAPECCKDCYYVQLHDKMYPCTNCCRDKKDYFKSRKEQKDG